jgi:hypothetical protein
MEISWNDHVRNEELLRVKKQRNILHEISKQKANWISHIVCRNCLLRQVIEGKIGGIKGHDEEEEDIGSCWMTLGKERILTSEGGSSRSHYVESWLWRGFKPVLRRTIK